MPRCACASEVYTSSVFVCVCRLLQLLNDERRASKSFLGFVLVATIIIIKLCSRVMAMLTLMAIGVSSDSCVAKFCDIISSALER